MKHIGILAGAALILALSGCASVSRVDQMSISGKPEQLSANTPLRNNIYLQVVSGAEGNNRLTQIGGGAFAQALDRSLRSAGLLAPSAEGRYGLTANIKKVDQRSIGADTVVTVWTDY